MNVSFASVHGHALRALLPPPRLPLSQWIEENLILPSGTSALPGPVRLWPYQREIADTIGEASIERVTLVKSVRVGFTTLLAGAVASYIANEPTSIITVLPTEADCRDHVVSDIEPLFEASPVLQGLLSTEVDEGGRNTLLHRRFPGGSFKTVAAKAPRNLRKHTAQILAIDEADAMLAGPEGSPLTLAERRTLSYANRKIIIGSTPRDTETSNVLRLYALSDQRVFEVPCPSCGGCTEILWQHIVWEKDQPETATFRCPHCEELIEERHKPALVSAGRWRATRPEVIGHAGFRLNALISQLVNASWAKLAAEYLASQGDDHLKRVFDNTILAIGWDGGADGLDGVSIQSGLTGSFGLDQIPAEVLFISLGVDVQDDRLELSFVGWSRNGEAYVLDHHVIWGSPDDDTTWQELDEVLRSTWQHPAGGRLKIDAAIVDSGDGDWTEKVYSFCFPRASRRVMAGKGVTGNRPFVDASRSKIGKNKARGGRLWIVGSDSIKTTIFSRLTRGVAIRFSDSLPLIYFEQLASEHKVTKRFKGQWITRFEQIPGRRNEALDCLVYAFAARWAIKINADTRAADLANAPQPAPAPNIVRSTWMQRASRASTSVFD